MSHGHDNPLDHPEVKLASPLRYFIGYVFALGMMILSLGLVKGHVLPTVALTAVLSLIAFIVIMVQLYFLFHLDLSETQIWHTVALVLTVPLFFISIALTIWMFYTLELRTMIPGVG
ncbi:cytochrome o ubiquinol oxidase subunit IV [Acidihalobacter prosperus]